MSNQVDRVNILIVDDRPEKLVALQVVLEDLGEDIVPASSGRDALRQVLRQSFAVILLDINMPGMDGFETAQLLRQYRGSKHTPIIFLTAAGDEMLAWKSYALGAVDYMMTPVIADVLRSKVRVFVELFRKNEQVTRQAESLRRQAARLHKLTRASLAINSVLSLDGILQAITAAGRDIVGAHQVMTTLAQDPGRPRSAVALSPPLDQQRPEGDASALYRAARPQGGAARLTQAEIDADPTLRAASLADGGPPRRGLLAAPLTDREGRAVGLIQLSDPHEGDFTDEDEALLTQLSQLGSLAIQNCLLAEAREANRLKDEFLATLSHELRTPLNAILGWTRLLRKGAHEPARMARALEVIERNVNVQTTLIEELLDVSRISAGKLRVDVRPLALGPVLEAAVDAQRPTAEARGIHLECAPGSGGGRVLGDAERLHQVIGNLVGNALKFTPKGGRVDVALRRADGDVELLVTDTGVGIAPEFLPFVFERFRQADSSSTRAQGGLGLGLAVVRHLVELHGGSVHAESPGAGRGATFVVRLPELLATAPSRAPAALADAAHGERDAAGTGDAGAGDAEPPPSSGVQTLDGLRVLIVDDDDDARELLKEVLSQHSADVTTASSASEALAIIDALRPDVLVSDVAMRGEDGYELIRRVRVRALQEGGGVPALALTAYARTEDRLRALEAGFQMHAAKPIEPMELIVAVARLASGRGSPPEGA